MAYKNYLIFDFGASNGRAIVAKYDGSKFSMDIIHRFDNRPVYAVGTLYWDILRLYSELKIGLMKSVKKYKNITSMALNTWGVDFGFIDKNRKLIANPIHYRDEKRNSVVEKVYKIISEKSLFNLTGLPPISIASLFNMYSLKMQNATELVNAHRFLMMPDIFNYFLTGKKYNEFTISTTTLMFNQRENKWEEKILNKIGISMDIFPPIIMPGTKIGDIQKDVASELEIRPITVIAPATHDTASAVVGIPVVDKNRKWVFISMGTWCVVGIETKEPLIKDEVLEYFFANEGGVESINLLCKNITGLWIIQKCRERWIKEKEEDISWDEIVNMSSKAKPWKSFINVDEPLFSIPQINMPEKVAQYCKNKGQDIPDGIGEVSRCVYESLTLRFRCDIEILQKLTGINLELIHLVGGGTKNKLLCQWIADATGLPVYAGPIETTSVGNLLMQLYANSEINSLEEGRKISLDSSEVIYYEPRDKDKWDEAYNRYLKIL